MADTFIRNIVEKKVKNVVVISRFHSDWYNFLVANSKYETNLVSNGLIHNRH